MVVKNYLLGDFTVFDVRIFEQTFFNYFSSAIKVHAIN